MLHVIRVLFHSYEIIRSKHLNVEALLWPQKELSAAVIASDVVVMLSELTETRYRLGTTIYDYKIKHEDISFKSLHMISVLSQSERTLFSCKEIKD